MRDNTINNGRYILKIPGQASEAKEARVKEIPFASFFLL